MFMVDWTIVYSVVTALGLFEIVKRVLIFWFENNVIKRNLEIRAIAERALVYCNSLKLRNFEAPLSTDEIRLLNLDISKIDQWDKKLGDELMTLINYPVLIETFYKNSLYDNEYRKLMIQYHKELQDKVDKLVPVLNQLRYKPVIEIGKWKMQ